MLLSAKKYAAGVLTFGPGGCIIVITIKWLFNCLIVKSFIHLFVGCQETAGPEKRPANISTDKYR